MIGKIEETRTVETKLPDVFWLGTDIGDDDWTYHSDDPGGVWDLVHRIRLTQPDFAAIAREIASVDWSDKDRIESILRERLG